MSSQITSRRVMMVLSCRAASRHVTSYRGASGPVVSCLVGYVTSRDADYDHWSFWLPLSQ